jgi:signal transduction histidine kinase
LFAVLVGEAGLFIGLRAALVTGAASAALGAAVAVLAAHGVIQPGRQPGPWLDWFAGVFVFVLVAILVVSAVRLYRGGLELARQASRRHRALFDGAPIALVEVDLHTDRIHTTDVNDAARRLLGPSGPPAEVLSVLADARARGESVIEQELALELGGEPRWIVMRAELSEQDAELHHVIVSLADVTEQRRLAERVHDARRFETVASLAGSVAHDFNNLLTVSQLNAERLAKQPALAGRSELERIRDANTRIASLTRQLLVFSRRDVANRQRFDPERVLAKLEPLLRRTLDTRIELAVALPAADLTVEMDPAQLELLVMNLVHNAADAIADRGTIRIACRKAGDHVAIAVRDTGKGMDAATREHAFDPFFTTRPGKRPGLGLAIVRSIAKDAGGTVALESSPAEGTCVEVSLPVVAPASVATAASTSRGRILLVEDNDGVRDIARTTLEEAGYTVVAVSNANEALVEVATERRIDLVVSDLVMPGLGGRELVERLRANDPKLPVLYVSGFAADGPPVLDGTGVGFLAKPFTGTQLLASVRAVLPAAMS